MEYYDNDVSVHSVYIQTVFYGLCLKIKYILSLILSYLIGGAPVNVQGAPTTACILYDVETDLWVVLAQLETPTICAGAVCVGDSKLMVVSGHDGRMKQARCLDLRTGTWRKCPDLLQGVVYPAVGCADKSVFVIFPTNNGSQHERRVSEVSLQCFNTTTSC